MALSCTEENIKFLSQDIESILNDGANKQVKGVTKNNKTEILTPTGLRSPEKEDPMTTDFLYPIFSCTNAIV